MTAAVLAAWVTLLQVPLPPGHPVLETASYVPQRVFDTRRKAFTDFERVFDKSFTCGAVERQNGRMSHP